MPSTHHTSNIFLAQGLDKENVVSFLYTYVLKTYKTYKSLYKTYKNHIKTYIGFTVCSLKKVKQTLVLLCFRSPTNKQWFCYRTSPDAGATVSGQQIRNLSLTHKQTTDNNFASLGTAYMHE